MSLLNCSSNLAPRRASALHEKIEFLPREKFLHLLRHLLHPAIIREEDKRASLCFFDKMRDPMLERLLVTGVPRVGHFLHNEHLHLATKIEWTPEQQRLGFVCADAPPEIREISATNRERRACHYTGAILAKNHSAQHRRDIDRRGI